MNEHDENETRTAVSGSRHDRLVICGHDPKTAMRLLPILAVAGLSVGVNIADCIPEPRPARETTKADSMRLKLAEEKRRKRNAKRLKAMSR